MMVPPRRVTPLDVMAWVVLLLALTSLAVIRIDPDGTPWHLATAREAFRTGSWPTANTFSYTHPEYPIYQQYPIYQAVLFAVFQWWGWEGLSALHGTAWGVVLVLAVWWAGGVRRAVTHPLVWAIVILGLQRRMILRPDIGTLICLLAILITSDVYARRPWSAAAAFVCWQWIFANTHQLYPIGLALMAAYWVELVWRRRVSQTHAESGAVAVAERGAPSRSASSPNTSPGPSMVIPTRLPLEVTAWTRNQPDSITWRLAPGSPWWNTTSFRSKRRRTIRLRMRRRSASDSMA